MNTPFLDNFTRNLTELANSDLLDPVVGREKEIERVSQILSRRKKNNPILIGEPGVGKSAIAEGLSLRITQKKVSRALFNKKILSLDLASMVAGTKYRGQFEERIKGLLEELENNQDIILFIDEIHTIIGAGGSSGTMDAANIIKPALANGRLRCIGATTLDEYRESIEKDGALERRFQKVLVEPTSVEETLEILNNIKDKYEDHHNVTYTEEAIEACVKLTDRYLPDRYLPDKAIDALDETGSRVNITNVIIPKIIKKIESELEDVIKTKNDVVRGQRYEEAAKYRDIERKLNSDLGDENLKWQDNIKNNRKLVDIDDVSSVVSMITGIPLSKITEKEFSKLIKMEPTLSGSVIGQNEAIKKVAKAIQRNRAGLKDPNKPVGSFIFLGPTGVGKTQLCKVLAKYLFDSEDALIRIDMSEYMEKFAVSRLVGAPPGYVGYEEGGQLTEKVRRKPYSIVLLDEIEKAHPDVFNILLQVLDDGMLTDSSGRLVSFKNTIIIMTSNIGARQLQDFGSGIGFSTKNKLANTNNDMLGIIQKSLKRTFAPEFLNRIDDIVTFNSLLEEDILSIVDIELKKLNFRLIELGYKLKINKRSKEFISEIGYDEKFGARPLKRSIQKYIEDPISEKIIKNEIIEGDTIIVTYSKRDNDLVFKINQNKDE
jgi:ATP-dependent Clp protease ATP-binding subunit ClpC